MPTPLNLILAFYYGYSHFILKLACTVVVASLHIHHFKQLLICSLAKPAYWLAWSGQSAAVTKEDAQNLILKSSNKGHIYSSSNSQHEWKIALKDKCAPISKKILLSPRHRWNPDRVLIFMVWSQVHLVPLCNHEYVDHVTSSHTNTGILVFSQRGFRLSIQPVSSDNWWWWDQFFLQVLPSAFTNINLFQKTTNTS